MRKAFAKTVWLGSVFLCTVLFAVQPEEVHAPEPQGKALPKEISQPDVVLDLTKEPEKGTSSPPTENSGEASSPQVGGMMQAGMGAGGAIAQGFTLSALRFTTYGSLGSSSGYRIALGQTREISSILLPQLVPYEAYAILGNLSKFGIAEGSYLKIGAIRPQLNPLWSPDLGALWLPGYLQVHQATLLSNDLGVELFYEVVNDRLDLSLGVFNGSGVFAVNTNSSRALTTSLRSHFPMGPLLTDIGIGGMGLSQASEGSVNFKTQWAGNAFVNTTFDRVQLGADITWGQYQDSVHRQVFTGETAWTKIRVLESIHLFGVVESLTGKPPLGESVFHAQLGPILSIDKNIQFFIYYDLLMTQTATAIEREDTGQMWIRVAL